MDEDLKKLIKEFMLQNSIGYLWVSASTNIEQNNIKFDCDIEFEENIRDQGYQC